jgi:hypothetical protein
MAQRDGLHLQPDMARRWHIAGLVAASATELDEFDLDSGHGLALHGKYHRHPNNSACQAGRSDQLCTMREAAPQP